MKHYLIAWAIIILALFFFVWITRDSEQGCSCEECVSDSLREEYEYDSSDYYDGSL